MASLLSVAFATCWITSASAAPGLTVAAIQRDGAATVSVPGVMLRSKGVETAQVSTLALQQELQDGVEIIVPIRTVITFKSSNGNTITLQPGSRFTVRHVGDDGESYTLDDGGVAFDVVKALNFFNVNYRKFLAIVKGTKFSVEVEPEKEIRFAVTEGTVVVEREVRVLIAVPGQESKTSDLTVHDALQAGRQDTVKYRLGVESYLRKFDTFEGAEEFFRKQLAQDELSGDNARIVDSLRNLAVVLRDIAKPKLAIPLLERTRSLAGHATRPQIDSLTDLALIYTRERKLEQAREFLQLALTLFSSADNALPLTCLACIQQTMGNTFSAEQRHDQAIIWYERSLQTIGPPISKEQYRSTSGVHNSIAWAHADAGRPSAALKYAQKALGVRESMYDRRAHPELVSSYKLLSFIYRQLGDYREAANQTEKALQQLTRLFPDQLNPQIAENYWDLAQSKLGADDVDSAADALRRSRSILEVIDPDKKSKTWPSLYSTLGELEQRRGNYVLALEHAARALDLSVANDKDFPTPVTAGLHVRLGEKYFYIGDYVRASKNFEDSLALQKKFFPDINTLAATTLRSAARALIARDRPDQALEYYLRAIVRLERVHANLLHRSVAVLQSEAAEAARLAGGWQAAIPYFEASLNTLTRLQPDNPGEEVARLQTRLFLAWTALGDEQKANHYAREAQVTRDRLDAQAQLANRKEP